MTQAKRRVTGAPLRLGVTLVVAWLGAGTPTAQSPPLEQLLDKATQYELRFVDLFSNVVAEEIYVQEMSTPRATRRLVSDVALVRYPGAPQWLMFRDVREVDGKPVQQEGRQERIERLFLEPPRSALRRAAEIAQAGARFNLVNIGTLNNPLLALAFLQPDYRPRFRFNRAGMDKKVGETVRTVRFEEFRRPTILRSNANNDLLARGLLWIDEQTGRVVKTELEVGAQRTPAEIITTYRHDDELDIDVPSEMREWYPDGAGEVRGVATYGKFRRFQVRTDETVQQ